MKKIFLYTFIVAFFSCEKEETPVPKHQAGDAKTLSVSVSSDYKYQVYFNLNTGEEVSRNLKTDWDLGFFCSDDRVFLNSSKVMLAAEITGRTFDEITDTTGLVFKWDYPSLQTDSLALSNWKENSIYVVQLGFNEKGENLGLRKLEFIKSDNLLKAKHAKLDNSDQKEVEITKDQNYYAVYLSFEKGVLKVEPPKNTWDIVFTQYTHVFKEPAQTYLVLGILLSPDVQAIQVDSVAFENIKYEFAKTLELTSQRDIIGYDWKEYSFDTQSYRVFAEKNYVISSQGKLYKLHFVDFYDTSGQKGNPTFEIQAL